MMRNNDLRETSDERWRRPAAAEAADFPEELRRSRCTRLINYPNLFVTSPTKVYIDTSAKCSYYSQNDERMRRPRDDLGDRVRLIDVLERTCRLDFRTVLQDGEFEIQDLIAFFGTFIYIDFGWSHLVFIKVNHDLLLVHDE
uniref:SFRICE_040544 n=1 Tax=Spodoptera frugiperda TaxID=7108 RepID=A0A2H1W7X4_SPOFR